MHPSLRARLLKNSSKGYMFHYLDSVNSPALVVKKKRKSPYGYILTAIIAALAIGLICLSLVIHHA